MKIAPVIACAALFAASHAVEIVAATPAKGPLFLTEPIAENATQFSGARAGHDFVRVAQAARKVPTKKGEFETSEAFDKRVVTASDMLAYGNVRLQDRLMTTGNLTSKSEAYKNVYYLYDADKQEFRLCLSWQIVMGFPKMDGFTSILVEEKRQALGNYVGTNALN